MKAILVIDMPTSCIDCPFTLAHICDGGKQAISNIRGRHESCPLKPLPERRQDIEEANLEAMFNDGFNACLDELEDPNGFNYETIKALKDSEEGKNLSKAYDTVDELMADIEDELEEE